MDLRYKDINYCKGVGSKRADLLRRELHVESALDLLYIFPYKYIDRSQFYQIRDIEDEDTYVQIVGVITEYKTVGVGKAQRMTALFTDKNNDTIELVWFQGVKYLKLEVGVPYIMFGKPSEFNHTYNIVHPELERLTSESQLKTRQGLEPHYNTSEKMKTGSLNDKAMRTIIQGLLPDLREGIPDTLPMAFREKMHLVDLTTALLNIHFPKDQQSMQKARERLKFEELFYLQLSLLKQKYVRSRGERGIPMPKVGDPFNRCYEALPFPLTGAQKRVLREIREDVRSGAQMNRLLQGDVGSGKTMVALMGMLIALDNGYQACMMAPTEILSGQHYANICHYLEGMDVRVELLTGSIKGKRRQAILEGLASGDVRILVSTHAVLEDNVVFSRLGFVVIDEQHRFGVAQRARLWGKNDNPPHVLVMTATPIPRTLAMTLYGDLDVSVIDELPPGRKPVRTEHFYDTRHSDLYAFVEGQLKAGRQAYIVYPLIEESAKSDLKNLEDGFATICERFPGYGVSKVHGRMKPAEKDAEMMRFKSGETRIMVATTVIEVGVDVPNASVMVIENAERFGLSQLHQLRGRVGRGADQSYCILVTGFRLSDDTRHRIDIMVETCDGFEIAEADLKLRGPGDLEGTQQSGIAFDLKLANLARDGELIGKVRAVAQSVISADPLLQSPDNAILVRQLARLRKTPFDWSSIS